MTKDTLKLGLQLVEQVRQGKMSSPEAYKLVPYDSLSFRESVEFTNSIYQARIQFINKNFAYVKP